MARDRIADFRIMNINFYPRESRVVTFRDPWSFPVLFHPGCNHLIKNHLQDLAQKVCSLVYSCLSWNSELIIVQGCLTLCLFGRISRHPILPAAIPNS